MNEDTNKESNDILSMGKIIKCIGIIIIGYVIYQVVMFLIAFDGNWNTIIMNACYLLFLITIIIRIIDKKRKKLLSAITFISLIVIVLNALYFVFLSMKIEPLMVLNQKYKINNSDMKIIESTKSSRAFIFGLGASNRSATINYNNEYYIYLYYDNGWKDDYENRISYIKKNKSIIEKFSNIINTYETKYQINNNTVISERVDEKNYTKYYYNIYIYNSDENAVNSIINQLNNYVTYNNNNYHCELYYELYITKDKKLYDELIRADKSLKNEKESINNESLFAFLNYTTRRITYDSSFKKEAFVKNGDEKNREYRNPDDYDYILFLYRVSSEPEFQVFGIKK